MADDGAPALEVRALAKRFGKRRVLESVGFTVARGELYGFIGQNGAGKTTTIRALVGLSRATHGTIKVFGASPARMRAKIGFAPQEVAVYDDLTCAENVAFFARLYGHQRPGEQARRVLERISLADCAGRRAGVLSGGQRRALNLALAIAHDPPLLVLDEPTVGLDIEMRERAWSLLRTLAQSGTTVLLTTHYLEEAERLCSRIAILAGGRIVAEGEPAELAASLGYDTILMVRTPELARAQAALAGHVLRVRLMDGALRAEIRGAPPLDVAAGWLRGIACSAIATRPVCLEDVYISRTGTG